MLVVDPIECHLHIEKVRDLIPKADVTYEVVAPRLTKKQPINHKKKKVVNFPNYERVRDV